jgi:hypothetical protein
MRFAYGPSWEKYPVMPGDLWRVGDHHLLCGDLEVGAGEDFFRLMGEHDPLMFPTMAYTDPPWDAGNARSFRTKAHTSTPEIETRAVIFKSLIWKGLQALDQVQGPVFVEMGLRNHGFVVDLAKEAGYMHLQSWPITYYKTKPCKLILLSKHTVGLGSDGSPRGMDEPAGWCIFAASNPGDVVFDPFMGQGLVAEEAARLGRIAWGIELNPRRLAVTLAKLAKATGEEPQRL